MSRSRAPGDDEATRPHEPAQRAIRIGVSGGQRIGDEPADAVTDEAWRLAPVDPAVPPPRPFVPPPRVGGGPPGPGVRRVPVAAPEAPTLPGMARAHAAPRSADVAGAPRGVAERSEPVRVGAAHGLPAERSEPIRVISMKDQTAGRRDDAPRAPWHDQPRSRAEAARQRDTPARLGNLAPPRAPQVVRQPRWYDQLRWIAIALVLATAVGTAVWWLAGR